MCQELLIHGLLHDLRGSATSLMGWQSLLPESAGKAVGGLERSIDGLIGTLRLFSGAPEPGGPKEPCALAVVADNLGLSVEGDPPPFELDADRLEAACWKAAATGLSAQIVADVHGGPDRLELKIFGLAPAGIRLLLSTQSSALVEAAKQSGPVLGACLFKEVVRGVRGDYVSNEDSGVLCLRLPLRA
jgi:hypothetical protein